MYKELAEFYINYCLNCGIDFAELFYEEKEVNEIKLQDSKIDNVMTSFIKGLGIRIAYKDKISYADVNNIEKEKILEIIDNLKNNYSKKRILENVKLIEEENNPNFFDIPNKEKRDLLYKINDIAKKANAKVYKVNVTLSNSKQYIKVANSNAKYVSDTRYNTLLVIEVIVKDKEKIATHSKRYGVASDYSFLKTIDIKKEVNEIVALGIEKLNSVVIEGGKMPAIIGPGFGAVIFHEAVGHALEATSVSTKTSILSNKYNKKVASSKVTLIDDGTIKDLWGTTYYDDEGNKTRKNVLINKGVITSYLIDEINSKKMKMQVTGSARRQNYKYAPTSRMNNTYLMCGKDKISDMIKSIKYGIYAYDMGGGSVDPTTGDFNFAVNHGYIIKNGIICEPVKLVSFIGNTLDIMKQVEMVSDDLKYGVGFCGSISGYVNTTIGEPTIKVSEILVGGTSND